MIGELISRIATTAFGNHFPAVGLSEDAIASAEAALGFRLPEPLRDLYATMGNDPRLLDADNHIPALAELELRDGHLVICRENQGGARWALEEASLDQPNPRVRGRAGRRSWQTESSRLSAFLINLVCWQAIMSMPETARTRLAEEDLDDVLGSLTFLGDKAVRSGAFRVSFAGHDERMLATYLYNTGQLYVGAANPEVLERFEKVSNLELDWL